MCVVGYESSRNRRKLRLHQSCFLRLRVCIWGLKTKQAVTCLRESVREDRKQVMPWVPRGWDSGCWQLPGNADVAAAANEVGWTLPKAARPALAPWQAGLLGLRHGVCRLPCLSQRCLFSPALPLRHGQGRAHCLVLEVILFFSASQPIPLSALGAFNSRWFSSLPPGLLPGLEEPRGSISWKNLQMGRWQAEVPRLNVPAVLLQRWRKLVTPLSKDKARWK